MEEKKLEESAKSKIHVISQKELLLIFWLIKAMILSVDLCSLSFLFPDKILPWRMLSAHQPINTIEASLLLHGPTPTGKDIILVTVFEQLLRIGFRYF